VICRSRENPNCQPVRRGVIISPGALGDTILMLPLAHFMKQTLALDQLEFIGHADVVSFWPGRSCVDRVRSLEGIAFHRLFSPPEAFELADGDPLIAAFAGYEWVVSFLGAGHADFESNLLFTVHCSHAAEVAVLPLKPPDERQHVSQFYIEALCREAPLAEAAGWTETAPEPDLSRPLLWPGPDDTRAGHDLLDRHGVEPMRPLAVLHPGSGGMSKMWPAENFCGLAEALASEGLQTVFLIGPAERDRLDAACLRRFAGSGVCLDGLDLSQVLQVLTCADVFCGNDSGVTHLAAALGCPTLALFGPTNPQVYRPCGPRVEVVADSAEAFSRADARAVERAAAVARRLLAAT